MQLSVKFSVNQIIQRKVSEKTHLSPRMNGRRGRELKTAAREEML